MRCLLIAIVALAAGCASYKTKVLQPWLGASEAEVVQKWGYPQSANDVVRIDDSTKVYTYRSARGSFLTPNIAVACVVSFTFRDDKVISDKFEGDNCASIARD